MSFPGFVIVSDDESGNDGGTVHTAVTDESGNQRLVPLSEASMFVAQTEEKKAAAKAGYKHIKRKGEYKCDLCTFTFASAFTLRHHRSKVHKDNQTNETSVMGRRYTCNICGEMTPSFKTLRVHKIACHAGEASLNVPQNMDESSEVRGTDGAAAFNYPGLLPYEVRRRQQLEGLIITDQYQASQIAAELQVLQTKTQPKRPRYVCRKEHRCNICHKNFASPSLLQRHQSVHTGVKPHSCPYCHKKYTQQEHVQRHIRWFHSGQNTRVTRSGQVVPVWYTCNVCGKQYYQKHRYVDHLRVHIEGLHQCPICQKEFAMKASLRRHLQTHSTEKNYECDLCSKRFANSQTLHNHKRYHMKEYRYKCTFCERGFEKKARLVAHVQKHRFDEDNPFECKLCWARFETKERLSEHVTLHTPGTAGSKPDLATTVKKNPKKKRNSNMVEVPNLRFQCSVCFGKFKLPSDLRRHCKLYHKEVEVTLEEEGNGELKEEEEEEDSTEKLNSSEKKEAEPALKERSAQELLQEMQDGGTEKSAQELLQEMQDGGTEKSAQELLQEMQDGGTEKSAQELLQEMQDGGTVPAEEPELEENTFTCALCEITFTSMEEIQLHMRLHSTDTCIKKSLEDVAGYQEGNMELVSHNQQQQQQEQQELANMPVATNQTILATNSYSVAPSHHTLTPVQHVQYSGVESSHLEAYRIGSYRLVDVRPGEVATSTTGQELQSIAVNHGNQIHLPEGTSWLSSDYNVCQPANDDIIMVPAANWPPTEQQMESGDLLLAIVSEHNRVTMANNTNVHGPVAAAYPDASATQVAVEVTNTSVAGNVVDNSTFREKEGCFVPRDISGEPGATGKDRPRSV